MTSFLEAGSYQFWQGFFPELPPDDAQKSQTPLCGFLPTLGTQKEPARAHWLSLPAFSKGSAQPPHRLIDDKAISDPLTSWFFQIISSVCGTVSTWASTSVSAAMRMPRWLSLAGFCASGTSANTMSAISPRTCSLRSGMILSSMCRTSTAPSIGRSSYSIKFE